MTTPDNPPEYNPNIPQKDDTIDVSQSNFLDNFNTLYDAFVTNHVALDDATNPGNHTVIELVEQTQSLNTAQQEISIYSKNVVGQTDQLFMRYNSNGKEFQITNYQIFSIASTSQQTFYFSFLPGGIMVYFGKVFSNGTTTFNIDLRPPICKNIFGINLGGIDTQFPQPNVAPIANANGKFNIIKMTTIAAMPNQFYLIFGNI